jgi:DNA topoisomerase I
VNDYIRDAAGEPAFSAKDFRTWTATVHAFRTLRSGVADSRGGTRRALMDALRQTAEELGNTLAVTRASYVHPGVVDAFGEQADQLTLARGGRAMLERAASRAEELELLRLLRRADRAAGAATRPKVGRARGGARARGSRA